MEVHLKLSNEGRHYFWELRKDGEVVSYQRFPWAKDENAALGAASRVFAGTFPIFSTRGVRVY